MISNILDKTSIDTINIAKFIFKIWIRKIDKQMVVVYNIILCSSKKKPLTQAITWMNLNTIVLSKKNKNENKNKTDTEGYMLHDFISLTFCKRQSDRDRNQIGGCQELGTEGRH